MHHSFPDSLMEKNGTYTFRCSDDQISSSAMTFSILFEITKVYATMRNPSAWDAPAQENIVIAALDVTSEESIASLVENIIEKEGNWYEWVYIKFGWFFFFKSPCINCISKLPSIILKKNDSLLTSLPSSFVDHELLRDGIFSNDQGRLTSWLIMRDTA